MRLIANIIWMKVAITRFIWAA